MTTELTSRLTLIRAHCTTVIEQAKLATEGPWRATRPASGRTQVSGQKGLQVAAMWNQNQVSINNAAFIATNRQFSPAAAEAVRDDIDAFRAIIDTFKDERWVHSRPSPAMIAEHRLKTIEAKFDYLWK